MNARSTNGRRPLHVLIAGGGVAGLEALLGLRHHAQERVSIELLAPEPQFWYRPLSVAEPFGLGRVHGLDLSSVADECGALFTLGGLRGIDTSRGTALTSTGAELDYDALLIAVGARPVESVPGAFTFRGPADSAAFGALLDELGKGKGETRRLRATRRCQLAAAAVRARAPDRKPSPGTRSRHRHPRGGAAAALRA